MKLQVHLMNGDLLDLEWDPSTGESGLKQCIHAFDESWSPGRQRLFRIVPGSIPFDVRTLVENDVIGLFLCPVLFVRFTASITHTLFAMHMSFREDFSYPHTTSLFFDFEKDLPDGPEVFRCYESRGVFGSIEEMIRGTPSIPGEMKDYWIEQAIPQWEEVMRWWPALREHYIQSQRRNETGVK